MISTIGQSRANTAFRAKIPTNNAPHIKCPAIPDNFVPQVAQPKNQAPNSIAGALKKYFTGSITENGPSNIAENSSSAPRFAYMNPEELTAEIMKGNKDATGQFPRLSLDELRARLATFKAPAANYEMTVFKNPFDGSGL